MKHLKVEQLESIIETIMSHADPEIAAFLINQMPDDETARYFAAIATRHHGLDWFQLNPKGTITFIPEGFYNSFDKAFDELEEEGLIENIA